MQLEPNSRADFVTLGCHYRRDGLAGKCGVGDDEADGTVLGVCQHGECIRRSE